MALVSDAAAASFRALWFLEAAFVFGLLGLPPSPSLAIRAVVQWLKV
jgi:hypothetical protein